MSRNFALLQIAGKEQEYFQADSGTPELVVVPTPPREVETAPADFIRPHDQQLDALCFEMEEWQLAELTKLVRGVFLTPGAEENRAVLNRVVVLASSESGNGCSWMCARVGEVLASQVSGRVCLVDANFRRATLHQHFGVPNHHGLSDALRQEGSIGGYVGQLSRRNLALVSAGSDFSSDTADRNMAAPERMRLRLQELRADFDYILVDGTSLDAGDESAVPGSVELGSIALGKMTDGIVLVLKTHSTRKEWTRSRVQDLKSAGVRILGAVLNQPAG